ncbi:hypothetical protein PQE66_gp107 [Bacillus phage PBC2]|uniref:Uncharacterized protein n=1 Tax=Bacillus phage PBC2 TaxID=1675029 RepID=A0A218KC04_9CAUD|nr:hypothetical protein PQE66_gp107 [Bacillus phage PBC2]AKQ08422.1 hypothetical protein PBC2_107 [Bacillus phage PBC2]
MPHIDGYADFLVEDIRVNLGYDAKDSSHDDEVLAKLTAGEKISKSKHLQPQLIKVTTEQHNVIKLLPKNTSEWKSIWRRVLLKKNVDPVAIERIINGDRYIVEDE